MNFSGRSVRLANRVIEIDEVFDVKIVPAAPIGGTAFVRALRGPFPDIPLWVSGGVKASEAQAYFEAGAQLVGLNAAEIPAALIDAGEWDAVSGEAAAMLVRAGLAGS